MSQNIASQNIASQNIASQNKAFGRSPENNPELPTRDDLMEAIRFITNLNPTSMYEPEYLQKTADVLNRVFESRESFNREDVLGTRYAMHEIRKFALLAS